jgi:GR25 family glycosyltransferase involved in LPS biosynthesis
MTNPWNFFDDIICINLEHRKDRKKYVIGIFNKLNIPIKILNVSKHPQGGTYGCFESHMKIINYMHETGKENILVFEDDIIPTQSYNIKHIENAIQFMKKNDTWDLFYLGYFPFNFNKLFFNSKAVSNNIINYNPLATHSYCINQRAISKILSNYEKYIGKMHIDVYFSQYANLNNYSYLPILFDQQLCFKNDIEPNNLWEVACRKTQCLSQKINMSWRISQIKYLSVIYSYLIIFIITIILMIIIIITRKI